MYHPYIPCHSHSALHQTVWLCSLSMKLCSNLRKHSQSECRQCGAMELCIWWYLAAIEHMLILSNIAQMCSGKIAVGVG